MTDRHPVEIGGLLVVRGSGVIETSALGSCVAVTLWDAFTGNGGLAHVMLPGPLDPAVRDGRRDRFASEAVPELVRRLVSIGSPRRRLTAKIAGGATMFPAAESAKARIGDRNVEEASRALAGLRIPVVARDTGGSHARSVELHLDSGLLVVRSYRYGIREL